ncbi:hypothetical protein BV25DRAFT_69473 [Artomyces pyxidatus]|uniref:Uncharacterized protein n=1 Tax=Artomyces pyxidatus TaxID=48021 RepID=A0ACB8TKN3_9AGAM|nr:hypothetical protein BV25DRAFT_69473 [Artomyces pyxidatus]
MPLWLARPTMARDHPTAMEEVEAAEAGAAATATGQLGARIRTNKGHRMVHISLGHRNSSSNISKVAMVEMVLVEDLLLSPITTDRVTPMVVVAGHHVEDMEAQQRRLLMVGDSHLGLRLEEVGMAMEERAGTVLGELVGTAVADTMAVTAMAMDHMPALDHIQMDTTVGTTQVAVVGVGVRIHRVQGGVVVDTDHYAFILHYRIHVYSNQKIEVHSMLHPCLIIALKYVQCTRSLRQRLRTETGLVCPKQSFDSSLNLRAQALAIRIRQCMTVNWP